MKWGDFRQCFRAYAWKRLTPHEVDPAVSNGHEFQGVNGLRAVLGSETRDRIATTYMLLLDTDDQSQVLRSWSSWYDSRRNQSHRPAEYRLYYPAEAGVIQSRMNAGDLMVIAMTVDDELLIMLAPAGSSRERELQLLFDLGIAHSLNFTVRSLDESVPLDFTAVLILEELGIGVVTSDLQEVDVAGKLIDRLAGSHPTALPSGNVVSRMVREAVPDTDPIGDPDGALFMWLELEDAVFRGWENRRIAARLTDGFTEPDGAPDVAGFREFAMALRQSRVSRAGTALQNHFAALLGEWQIQHTAQPRIDGGERPDFLFPSVEAYEDMNFQPDQLRMVGAKFTAKERWRQILNEAGRIPRKHMLTVDGAISRTQLSLMTSAGLSVILPAAVRARYPVDQSRLLYSVAEFLDQVSRLRGQ